jgi:hypothetical protein
VDNEGVEYNLRQEMCDYNMDRLAIAKEDVYIENDEGDSNGFYWKTTICVMERWNNLLNAVEAYEGIKSSCSF